jgi:hypothetical protein
LSPVGWVALGFCVGSVAGMVLMVVVMGDESVAVGLRLTAAFSFGCNAWAFKRWWPVLLREIRRMDR